MLCLLLAFAAVWLGERSLSGSGVKLQSAKISEQVNTLSRVAATTKLDTDEALDFIEFTDSQTGWAGNHGGLFYKTTDGGATWRQADFKFPFSGRVNSIHFASDLSGWVVLQQYRNGFNAPQENEAWLLRTDDGGRTWQVQFTAKFIEILRIAFVDANEGWVVGNKFSRRPGKAKSEFLLLHTVDGGTSWIDKSDALDRFIAESESGSMEAVRDMATDGSQTATVLLQSGLVINTRDGGRQWTRAGSVEPGIMITRIVTTSNNLTQIIGGQDGQHGTASFFAAGNNQNLWTENMLAGVYLKDAVNLPSVGVVACGTKVLDSNVHQGGQRGEGVILHSGDGLNWSVVYRTAEGQSFNALAVDSKGQIWAVGTEGRIVRLKVE